MPARGEFYVDRVVLYSGGFRFGDQSPQFVGREHRRFEMVGEERRISVCDGIEDDDRHVDSCFAQSYAFFDDGYGKICCADTL